MQASSLRPAADVPARGRPRRLAPDGDNDPDVRLLRAAANPSRLAILRRLECGGSVAACDFDCCDLRQPTVSHHLKVLREARWVRTERRASRVYYSLEPKAAERLREIAGELLTPSAGGLCCRGAVESEGATADATADGRLPRSQALDTSAVAGKDEPQGHR